MRPVRAGAATNLELAELLETLYRTLNLPRGHTGFVCDRVDRRP